MLVNEQSVAKTRWRPGPVPPMLEEEAISMGKNSSKSSGTGGRRTSMNPQAASRVQSAGAKNPSGRTAQSGFPARAQSAAAKGSRAAGK
ncbi:hypothetical protein [Streptomyces albidoflavus]|uniref:hypothetical protein n=1 Tax=Streptomyces albidoflavus TaxID=1886 RepID=UPI0021B0FC7C|nr:hypothetical protein [Streptomyces albidoflavus]